MTANVAEMMKELHAEAHRGAATMLERYVAFVKQAAKGKLSPADAEQAAAVAYDLDLPEDRFERDVSTVLAGINLARQIEADDLEAASSREKGDELKAKLAALEQERRQTLAAQHRRFGEAHARQARRQEQARLERENPHLFADAITLTDRHWNAIRH
jgi:hypothetical protein